MVRRVAFALLLASSVVCISLATDDNDAIKEKLFKAKVTYDSEMSKFRKEASEWLDKREEAARKDGNKKLIDQIKEERTAFDETGELPKKAPTPLQQKPILAKKALEVAYAEAVKSYTRAKKDDQAAAVEAEWKVISMNTRVADIALTEIMRKAHAKTDGCLTKVKDAANGGKWGDASKYAKELNILGEALGKNKPPKGDEKSWKMLSEIYATNTKNVLKATEDKDAKAVNAGLGAINGSCGGCHKAHKP